MNDTHTGATFRGFGKYLQSKYVHGKSYMLSIAPIIINI